MPRTIALFQPFFVLLLQIHEQEFAAHSSKGSLEETGSFVIDKYAGHDTNFNVFAINRESGFLRSISVGDRRGKLFRGIQDEMAAYHILSVYGVPFEQEKNIGMNWTYTLERMPSPNSDNKHIVRVTSRAREAGEEIKIKFFTNVDTHAIKVTQTHEFTHEKKILTFFLS